MGSEKWREPLYHQDSAASTAANDDDFLLPPPPPPIYDETASWQQHMGQTEGLDQEGRWGRDGSMGPEECVGHQGQVGHDGCMQGSLSMRPAGSRATTSAAGSLILTSNASIRSSQTDESEDDGTRRRVCLYTLMLPVNGWA